MTVTLRRGWWKPWNWSTRRWVLAIVVSAVISPFETRWICLWQVPDVALPFNVEEVVQDDIPKEEDALVRYAEANQLFNQKESRMPFQGNSFKDGQDLHRAINEALEQDNPKWDDRLDQWILGRHAALEEYRIASEMERAGGPSLKKADCDSAVDIHQELRRLTRLAELEAVRLERSDELGAAWAWHLTNLRCARHCKMPRFIICQLIGSGVRSFAYRGIAHWVEHSSLTTEQLQVARKELIVDQAQRVPTSEILKANYLCLKNRLEQTDAPNYLFPKWNSAGPYEPHFLIGKRLALWTVGQPEILLRLGRQILVNSADQIELPMHLRRKKYRAQHEIVFARDHSTRWLSGQLDPERLNSIVDAYLLKMPGLKGFLLGSGRMDSINRLDVARRASLDVVLASHQYQRLHGEFPSSIERLVPMFLDAVPIDPMDATGAPMHYRREANGEAIVWSIGWNEIDDGGDIKEDKGLDVGYRIRLKEQTSAKSGEANPVRQEMESESARESRE